MMASHEASFLGDRGFLSLTDRRLARSKCKNLSKRVRSAPELSDVVRDVAEQRLAWWTAPSQVVMLKPAANLHQGPTAVSQAQSRSQQIKAARSAPVSSRSQAQRLHGLGLPPGGFEHTGE